MEMSRKKSIQLVHRLDYGENIELNTQSKSEGNDFAIKSKKAEK